MVVLKEPLLGWWSN